MPPSRLVLAFVLTLTLAGCAGTTPGGPPVQTTGRATHPTGTGGVNAPEAGGRPYVVLVSFDGFRHDYLDRYDLPSFERVARAGVRADALIPVFPTLTFPNHYSIATGMYAGRHGLLGNTIRDPARGATYRMSDRDAVGEGAWYGGEPIWVTAETQGMVAASYFWVGTEAPVAGVRPTHWKPYDGEVPYAARVDSVLTWLGHPEDRRPHVVLLYFSAVDSAGHEHGPDSPEVAAAVARVDSALGRLLDGLAVLPHGDRVNVVLVSDHGMAQTDDAQRVVLTDYVALPDDVLSTSSGPHLALWLEEAAADSVDAILDRMLPDGFRSYTRHEMPARWHFAGHPRTPTLVVTAESPRLVGLPQHFRRPWAGAHGYDPADPLMHGIFLAMGPQVRPAGRIAAFEVVHLYPFLTALLGLDANPAADGRLEVLAPILRDVPPAARPAGGVGR